MVIAVIPSRFLSSRFPGKALVAVEGVPLVVWVTRRVMVSQVADQVIVATDDPRICEAVGDTGACIWMSREPFRSGSDRVAAAVAEMTAVSAKMPDTADTDRIINVQGDEVLVNAQILTAALAAQKGNAMGTVAVPLDPEHLQDRDAVKVQLDTGGRAEAFSRGPLTGCPLLHVGVYCFTRESLERFAAAPSSPGEVAEGLEQLRALELGMSIGVRVVDAPAAAVNRPGDMERIGALLEATNSHYQPAIKEASRP